MPKFYFSAFIKGIYELQMTLEESGVSFDVFCVFKRRAQQVMA
jgi:hypothetical protein